MERILGKGTNPNQRGQMTAQEMINKRKFNTDEPIRLSESDVEYLMNEFAIHIAEQAEKRLRIESRNEPQDTYTMGYLDGSSDMVSRIKTLTEEQK